MLNQLLCFEINEKQMEYMDNKTSIYLCFKDYIRHFLSLIGYTNLKFLHSDSRGKELSFWDKKEILYFSMKKEVCRLSGKKTDEFNFHDPVIKWAYAAMIGYFSFIWTKEMKLSIDYQELQRLFISDPDNSVENIENKEIAETFYKLLEPYIISHRYTVVQNHNNERHICEYCGSRYDYEKVSNCPSCGA